MAELMRALLTFVAALTLAFPTSAPAHTVYLWNVVYYPGHSHVDVIHGDSGSSELHGDSADDLLYGEAGNDYLYGNYGNDRLDGGTGYDYCRGGIGSDYFVSCEVIVRN